MPDGVQLKSHVPYWLQFKLEWKATEDQIGVFTKTTPKKTHKVGVSRENKAKGHLIRRVCLPVCVCRGGYIY